MDRVPLEVNPLAEPSVAPLARAKAGGIASQDPRKIRDAAQQFEALLLAQILESAHTSGSGWFGSGGDSSSDCATSFAQQQLANMMAEHGGLGLADVISTGLEAKR
jgi:Rod binding domain-containing protein